MFGAIKRLFSKSTPAEPLIAPPAWPQPVKPASVAPPPPPPAPVKPVPAPARVATTAPATPFPSAPPPNTGEPTLSLPLASIVASLPPNLAPLAVSTGRGNFALPVKTALAQLPNGAVKVSFGELRRGSPAGSFADNATQDGTIVSLPLPPILASIDPTLLGRRAGQRVTAIPDSVTSIFGKIRPINATTSVAHAAASAENAEASETEEKASNAAAPSLPETEPVPLPAPVSIPLPAAPEAGASAFTRPPVTPSLPKLSPRPPGAASLPSTSAKMPGVGSSPSSNPLPSLAPKSPAAPKAPAPSVMPFAAPKPPPLSAPVVPPAPVAPVITIVPTPILPAPIPHDFLIVAVADLMASWPPAILQEIEQFQLSAATISLPYSRLEAAMKTGRVVFTWGELSSWLNPASSENSAVNHGTALDLPLKVLAPLFMARRIPGAAQKKIIIASQIPDLFAGVSKPAEPAAAPAIAVAPIPAATESAAPIPSAEATVSVLGEAFGQPEKSEWSPQEITQQISLLKGVAGSVLATGDGLLMAGQLPAPLRAETVAAFMPQILGRVSQYAGEMQMGAVTSLVLATGRGHCAIYKTGKLYWAVLGYPEETLPEAALGKIASELATRNA
jgi:predicted regulator of Ras-like GTPase activity (Roadblock/LC7/MglB family)